MRLRVGKGLNLLVRQFIEASGYGEQEAKAKFYRQN